MNLMIVLLATVVAGIATIAGSIAGMRLHISKRLLDVIIAASAGLTFSIAAFGLAPHAFVQGALGYSFVGFVIGGFLVILLDNILPNTYNLEKFGDRLYSILRTDVLASTGLAVHSIPMAFAIGAGFAVSQSLGLAVAAAVVLKNITSGIAVIIPLQESGHSRAKIILISSVSLIVILLGGLALSSVLDNANPVFLSAGVSFALGAVLYASADEILALVRKVSKKHETAVAIFLGFAAGFLILGMGM